MKEVVVILDAVTAPCSSPPFSLTGAEKAKDYLSIQSTHPVGSVVVLQATLDGSTWEDEVTWSSSGQILTAPNLGGGLYRVTVATYAGPGAVTATATGSGQGEITLI